MNQRSGQEREEKNPSAPKHAIDTPDGGPSDPAQQPNPGDPGPPVLRPSEEDRG